MALPAAAQTTISRGTNLSVDATRDGRLAIDLRGDIWIVPGGGGDAQAINTRPEVGAKTALVA